MIIVHERLQLSDLGVVVTCNMSFSLHINAFTEKAGKILRFIKRNTSNFKNINALKTLILSLVSTHLKLGLIVWWLSYSFYIKSIENFQRKFSKVRNYTLHLSVTRDSYHSQIFQTGLVLCELRRNVADIMLVITCLTA